MKLVRLILLLGFGLIFGVPAHSEMVGVTCAADGGLGAIEAKGLSAQMPDPASLRHRLAQLQSQAAEKRKSAFNALCAEADDCEKSVLSITTPTEDTRYGIESLSYSLAEILARTIEADSNTTRDQFQVKRIEFVKANIREAVTSVKETIQGHDDEKAEMALTF